MQSGLNTKASKEIQAVFAYGTLKTGHCRHCHWPFDPIAIEKAWTMAELYDLGPYPAIIAGEDCVAGELRWFLPEQIGHVLEVLDEVEDYHPGRSDNNLYIRQVIQCQDQQGLWHAAQAYFYADAEAARASRRIEAAYVWGDRRLAVWPEGDDW